MRYEPESGVRPESLLMKNSSYCLMPDKCAAEGNQAANHVKSGGAAQDVRLRGSRLRGIALNVVSRGHRDSIPPDIYSVEGFAVR